MATGVRRLGLGVMLAGAIAQVGGLVVDAWLHAADPTLAEREGVFSLSNAGHALLIGGIALVVVGATLAAFGPTLYRRRLHVVVPIVLLGLLGSTTALAATSSLAHGHDHAGATHTTSAPTVVHAHGDGRIIPDQPLDTATRDALASQLVGARAAAARYATVADAERDGYVLVAPYLPLIGSHYMKFSLVDGRFDVDHPEMLLYDGTRPGSRIVGLSYYALGRTQPDGFAGPNDHWHQHLGLCLSRTRVLVIGGESTTPEQCAAMGGYKADGSDAWMVHAWVVPGWDSPQGVFSAENPDLR